MVVGSVDRRTALPAGTSISGTAICGDRGNRRGRAADENHGTLVDSCDSLVLPARPCVRREPLESQTDPSDELRWDVLGGRTTGCIWLLFRVPAQPFSPDPMATPNSGCVHAQYSRPERARFGLPRWAGVVVPSDLAYGSGQQPRRLRPALYISCVGRPNRAPYDVIVFSEALLGSGIQSEHAISTLPVFQRGESSNNVGIVRPILVLIGGDDGF